MWEIDKLNALWIRKSGKVGKLKGISLNIVWPRQEHVGAQCIHFGIVSKGLWVKMENQNMQVTK